MEKILFYIEENSELLIYPIMVILLYLSLILASEGTKKKVEGTPKVEG